MRGVFRKADNAVSGFGKGGGGGECGCEERSIEGKDGEMGGNRDRAGFYRDVGMLGRVEKAGLESRPVRGSGEVGIGKKG